MKITDVLDIHPDIMAAEIEYPHGNGNIIRVISPGLGIGGDKVEHTVTIVYECECDERLPHEHQALYGPAVEFADSCKTCHLLKMWCDKRSTDHTFEALGEDTYDYSHMTLYAD